MAANGDGTVWRKSSRSNGGEDACVEVARIDRSHAVRDSKNPSGPILTLDALTWRAFLSRVKAGSLDL